MPSLSSAEKEYLHQCICAANGPGATSEALAAWLLGTLGTPVPTDAAENTLADLLAEGAHTPVGRLALALIPSDQTAGDVRALVARFPVFSLEEEAALCRLLRALGLWDTGPLPLPTAAASGVAGKSRVLFFCLTPAGRPLHLVAKFDAPHRARKEKAALEKLARGNVYPGWLRHYEGSLVHWDDAAPVILYRAADGYQPDTDVITLQAFLQKVADPAARTQALDQALACLAACHHGGHREPRSANWGACFALDAGARAALQATAHGLGYDVRDALRLCDTRQSVVYLSAVHGDPNLTNFLVSRDDQRLHQVMMLDFADYCEQAPAVLDYVKLETELWLECFADLPAFAAEDVDKLVQAFQAQQAALTRGDTASADDAVGIFAGFAARVRAAAAERIGAAHFVRGYQAPLCLAYLRALGYPSVQRSALKTRLAAAGARAAHAAFQAADQMRTNRGEPAPDDRHAPPPRVGSGFDPERIAPPRVGSGFDPERIALPPRFVGRATIMAKMAEKFELGGGLSLVGERRIGKSSLLATFHQQQTEAGHTVVLLDAQQGYCRDEGTFVAQVTGKPCNDSQSDRVADRLESWAVERGRHGRRPMLLIDEFESIAIRFEERFFERLRGMLPRLAVIPATSRSLPDVYARAHRTSPFHNQMPTCHVALLEAGEAEALVRGAAPDWEAQRVAYLLAQAGPHPYFLQLLGQALAKEADYSRALRACWPTMVDLFKSMWRDHLSKKERRLLLAASAGETVRAWSLEDRGVLTQEGKPFGAALQQFLEDLRD